MLRNDESCAANSGAAAQARKSLNFYSDSEPTFCSFRGNCTVALATNVTFDSRSANCASFGAFWRRTLVASGETILTSGSCHATDVACRPRRGAHIYAQDQTRMSSRGATGLRPGGMLEQPSRANPTGNTAFRVGQWRVDPALNEISRDGTTIKLELMRVWSCAYM